MSIIKVNQTSKGSKPLVMVFVTTLLISISIPSIAFFSALSSLRNAGTAWKDTQLLLKRVSQPTIAGTTVASAPATPRTLTASGLFQQMATVAVAQTITSFLIDSPSDEVSMQSFEKSASVNLLNVPDQTINYPLDYTTQEIKDYLTNNPQNVYVDLRCNSANPYTEVIPMSNFTSFVSTCLQAFYPSSTVETISEQFYPANPPNTYKTSTLKWIRTPTSQPTIACSLQLPFLINGTGFNTNYSLAICNSSASTALTASAAGFVDGIISFKVNSSYKFEPYPFEMDDEAQAIQPNSDQIIFQSTDDSNNPLVTYINISGNLIEYDNQHLDLQTRVRTRNRFHVRATDGIIVNHDNEISQNSEIINYFKANDTFQPIGSDTSTQTEIEIKEETETKKQNLTAIDTEITTLTQTKNEVKTKLETALQTETYTDPQTQTEYDFIGKIEQLFNEFQIQDPQLDLPELPNITLIPQFTPGDPVACEPIPFNYEAPTALTSYLNATSSIDICDQLGLARDLLGYTFYLVTLFFGWTTFYRQGRGS